MAGQADETVAFIFDGVQYSLNLSGNAGKIRAHMLPWLDACSQGAVTEKRARGGDAA
jgi:hypothetical protein